MTIYPMSSLKRNFTPFGPRLWRAERRVNIEIPVSTKKNKHGERNGCGFSHSHESLLCFFVARADDGRLRVAVLIVLRVCFGLHCSQSPDVRCTLLHTKAYSRQGERGVAVLFCSRETGVRRRVMHSGLFRCAACG